MGAGHEPLDFHKVQFTALAGTHVYFQTKILSPFYFVRLSCTYSALAEYLRSARDCAWPGRMDMSMSPSMSKPTGGESKSSSRVSDGKMPSATACHHWRNGGQCGQMGNLLLFCCIHMGAESHLFTAAFPNPFPRSSLSARPGAAVSLALALPPRAGSSALASPVLLCWLRMGWARLFQCSKARS